MNKGAGNGKQIRAYRDEITILKFVKDYQQNVIAELECLSNINLAKKLLPKFLADEIKKKKILLRKTIKNNLL